MKSAPALVSDWSGRFFAPPFSLLPAVRPFFFLLLILPIAAHATTLQLGASKDNTLYEDALGSLSNGTGPTFFAGTTGGGGLRRGLIEFDLGAIPAGSIIESVALHLFLYQAQSSLAAVGLYPTLAEWGEGASATSFRGGGGASAAPGDATWLHTFYNTSFWANPGGDFGPLSATTDVSAEGSTYHWTSTPALVADVQGWVDAPATNHGWLLRGDETQNSTAKAFATRDIGIAAERPSLSVTFTPAPEPSSTALLVLGLTTGSLRRRRST